MKITLQQYVFKEQIVPLSVCFLGVSLILITGRLLQLTRYLFTSSVTLLDLVELMAFAMPKLILYALPMATIIGVLLAFVRLNSDNELIALRAAGIGFSQFLPSVLCVLLLTTVLSFFNTIYVLPAANNIFENKLKSLGRASLPIFLKEGTFIDTIPKLVFFFGSVNPSTLSIEGIFVQDQRQPNIRVAIVAERAQIFYQRDLSHLIFKISDGIITRVTDDLEDAQAISFKAYDLTISLDEIFGAATRISRGKREMGLEELLQMIQQMSQQGDRKAALQYSLEFHNRLALPLGCLLIGLVGAPLGALFRQRSRMTGITLGIGVFLAYYIVLSAGKGLGENGIISPFFAVWTPNLLTAFAALYLWIKIQRETPFMLASFLKRGQPWFQSIPKYLARWKRAKNTT